jgi:hypothetical protein
MTSGSSNPKVCHSRSLNVKLLRLPRLVLLGMICAVAVGQEPGPAFTGVGANLVLVPTLIKTSSGEPVLGLTANDFILTDDGIEQKISLEENTENQPLALVIVVQTGGAGSRRLDSYRRLGPLLDSMVGAVPHRVAVVGFDSEPHIEAGFTADLNNVAGVMADLQPGDGGAAILDSLGFAVDLLRKQPTSYRRAILSISETLDHGSQSKVEDALRAIGDTNTTIYSLGFSTTKADMKHDADEFNSDFTPAPTHGCLAKDQSNGSDTHPVQVPDGKVTIARCRRSIA